MEQQVRNFKNKATSVCGHFLKRISIPCGSAVTVQSHTGVPSSNSQKIIFDSPIKVLINLNVPLDASLIESSLLIQRSLSDLFGIAEHVNIKIKFRISNFSMLYAAQSLFFGVV